MTGPKFIGSGLEVLKGLKSLKEGCFCQNLGSSGNEIWKISKRIG